MAHASLSKGRRRSTSLATSLLLSWILKPGTAIHAGLEDTEPLEVNPATGQQRFQRTAFMKLSYALGS